MSNSVPREQRPIESRQFILLAAASALLVAVIQFFPYAASTSRFVELCLAGIVAGQIAVVALWTSWSSAAAWKRWLFVLAYGGLPTYVVLAREWWFGGTLADGMVVYLADALLLLVLVAVLTPIRWLRGYRLSLSPHAAAAVGPGRFRLAELFGLTLIVAAAITLIVPGGARQIESTEMAFQAAMLAFVVGSLIALLLPSVRAVFSRLLKPLWLLLLIVYLALAVIAEAELYCQLVRAFKGPTPFPYSWEFRFMIYVVGAGFSLSLLASLLLLRLIGVQLVGGTQPVDPQSGRPIAAS